MKLNCIDKVLTFYKNDNIYMTTFDNIDFSEQVTYNMLIQMAKGSEIKIIDFRQFDVNQN